jgi:hypothetical protein
MSEVPIKHFWDTPHLVLDMSLLTNRIAELQDEVTTLTRERDALPKDAARLDWLESLKSYSISNLGGMACAHLWVTDGEDVRVTKTVTKPTIREAIDAAMEAKP